MSSKCRSMISILISLFMCFNGLLTPVTAEEAVQPEEVLETAAPQEEEPVPEAAETADPGEADDQPEIIAETAEPEPVEPQEESDPEIEETEPTPEAEVPEETEEPSQVYADEVFTFTENNSTKTIRIDGYTGSDTVLTIPSELESMPGFTVTEIKASAFKGGSYTSVTIADTVTTIGNNAFQNCTALTEIHLPSALTALGTYVFSGCVSLSEITIPENVTSIGNYDFSGCTNLSRVTLPSTLTSIGGNAFNNCTSLTSVTLPEGLTSISSNAFAGCTGLTSVTIPSTVTSISSGAFNKAQEIIFAEGMTAIPSAACQNASLLTKVTIPSTVTSIGNNAFTNCTSLESVDLPAGLTSIGTSVFSGCTKLSGVTLPSSLTSIGGSAFNNCTSLTKVNLPEGLTSIGSNAFAGCTGITSVTIPSTVTSISSGAFNKVQEIIFAEGTTVIIGSACQNASLLAKVTIPSTVTSIGNNAFTNCTSLESVDLPAGLTSIGSSAFSGCTKLSGVTLPSSLINIGNSAFYNCTSLTKMNLPEGLTTIGSNAFAGCTGITSVTIPSTVTSISSGAFNKVQEITFAEGTTVIPASVCQSASLLTKVIIPSTVTSIGNYAFTNCTSLESVALPAGLTSIGSSAFSGCTKLSNVTLPSSLTSIGSSAFNNCTSLTKIELPEGLTTIGGSAFAGCTGLTSVTIPSTVTNISSGAFNKVQEITFAEGTTVIPASVCQSASLLTKVIIPSTVTSIGNYAFTNCTSLESVALPAGLISIGASAFSGCTKISGVTLPSSLTSIGNNAFYNCTSLTAMNLPEGLTAIGGNAFAGCTGITSVTIPSSVTSIGSGAFNKVQEITFAEGMTAIPANACQNASLLTKVTIPSTAKTIGSSAFNNCTSLTKIDLPEGITKLETYVFSGGTKLSEVTLPSTLISIGNNAFNSCTSLTKIDLPEGLTTIGSSAFGNTGITSVTIPSTVTNISSGAFNKVQEITFAEGMTAIPEDACRDASQLTKVTLPSTALSLGNHIFQNCKLLEEIHLPDSIVSIGNNAFYGCVKLTEMELPSALKSIGQNAFSGCTGLKEIALPDGVESVGNSAFYGCTNLESLTTGDGVKIGSSVFSSSTALKKISLGHDVTFTAGTFPSLSQSGTCGTDLSYELDFNNRTMTITGTGAMDDFDEDNPAPWHDIVSVLQTVELPEGMTTVGAHAFDGARNIIYLNLPEGVEKIGASAFAGCDTLEYFEIPAAVSLIGRDAFAGCTALEEFVFCGNAPAVEGPVFDSAGAKTAVYVPSTGTGYSESVRDTMNASEFQSYDDTVDSLSVLLLLDVSGSMESRMGQLRESASSFVNTVGGRINKTSICIVSYHSSAALVQDYTTNTSQLRYQISKLNANGGTQYRIAMDEAYSYLSFEPADRNFLVMFSDGEPNDNTDPIYALADEIRGTYPIFTVGLSPTARGAEILKRIAGIDQRYFNADDISQLEAAFLQVGSDLERKEATQITMNRQNVNYDLLKEDIQFLAGSDETITLTILPSYLLGDYGEIWIEQNGEKIYQSTNGKFDHVQPGISFMPDEPVYAVIYDTDNTTVLEKVKIGIKVIDTVKVTYHYNYGNKGVYKEQAIKIGSDFSAPADPERDGYKFRGWYNNAKCSGISWFSAENTENRKNLTGNLDLYAKWTQYDPAYDAWGFTNSGSNFNGTGHTIQYEIRGGDYSRLQDSVSHLTDASGLNYVWESIDGYKTSTWGGSCFGMSSSSVLIYNDDFSIAPFASGVLNVHSAGIKKNTNGDADVGTIESMINFNHLRQKAPALWDAYTDSYLHSESENIAQIIGKLSGGNPCVMDIKLPYINGSGYDDYGAHAVVAYNLRKNGNTYTFHVYDCSMGADKDYVVTVNENNGVYSKECTSWVNAWGKSRPKDAQTNYQDIVLLHAFDTADLKSYSILTAPDVLSSVQALYDENDTYYILETSYASFTISDGIDEAVIVGGKKVSGNLNITARGNINFIGEEPAYMFILPVLPEGRKYSITVNEAQDFYKTKLRYQHNEDGFYSILNTASRGTYTFGSDGSVSTSLESAADQKIQVMTGNMNTPWYKVTVDVNSSGMTVVPSAENVTITSKEDTVMSVTAGSYFNSLTFENVPASEEETIIKGSDTDLCIIEHNGEVIGTDNFGYSVIFDTRLGSYVPSLKNVHKDSLLEKPADPTREGYFFEGWYKDEQYTEKWDFEKDTIQKDTVLYAGWSVDPNYFVTVTFRMPGGENQTVTVPNGYVLTEEEYPAKADGSPIAWYTDSECTKEWNSESAILKNTVLYTNGWNEVIAAFTVSPETATVYLEQKFQLSIVSDKADTYTWTSSDETVAVVDANGLVTGVSEGSAVITAVSSHGERSSSLITVYPEGLYVKDVEAEFAYTGTAIKPMPAVYDSGVLLTEGKDYTVSYKNNTNAKAYEGEDRSSYTPAKGDKTPYILITGKGNYSGKTYVPFSITQADLSDSEQVYVEESITLKANNKVQRPVPVITFNGKVVSSKEYTLTYIDEEGTELDKKTGPKEAGTYTIHIEGNDKNFTGEKDITLTIAEETVKEKTVALSKAITVSAPAQVYNGSEQTEIEINPKPAYEGIIGEDDYTVAFTKNVNAGTATVTVTGKGIYTGSVKKTFKINPLPYVGNEDQFSIDVRDAVYSKGGGIPEVTVTWNGTELVKGTDYTLKYANNKAVTTENTAKMPSVTVTFKGNFKGKSEPEMFEIAPKPLKDVYVTAKDMTYTEKAGKYKSTPVLTDSDGKKLKAGTDYEKVYAYTVNGQPVSEPVPAGTVVTVTIKAKEGGNYTGETYTTYRILEAKHDISKASFKISPKKYTGQAVTLEEGDIIAKINGEDMYLGEQYVIESYTNNVNKGTAKVTFRGIGEYGGTKTVSFKIGQRSIWDAWNGVRKFFTDLF